MSNKFGSWRVLQAILGAALPLVACLLVHQYGEGLGMIGGRVGIGVALLFTSPFLPVSLWAVFTQNVRDKSLAEVPSLLRGLVLVPYLAFSPRSQIKLATWVNIASICLVGSYFLS